MALSLEDSAYSGMVLPRVGQTLHGHYFEK